MSDIVLVLSVIHPMHSAWSVCFAHLSNTHLSSPTLFRTSLNQLADTVLQTVPARPLPTRPTSTENTGRKQLTNDGWDMQWRNHGLSFWNPYKTYMHPVYKTGQIVFLFPSAGLLLVWGKEQSCQIFHLLSFLTPALVPSLLISLLSLFTPHFPG